MAKDPDIIKIANECRHVTKIRMIKLLTKLRTCVSTRHFHMCNNLHKYRISSKSQYKKTNKFKYSQRQDNTIIDNNNNKQTVNCGIYIILYLK